VIGARAPFRPAAIRWKAVEWREPLRARVNSSALKRRQVIDDDAGDVIDEPSYEAAYDEYVRGFDHVPVLRDAVRVPAGRAPEPNFPLGERRDARREPRPDPFTTRETKCVELAELYEEYQRPPPPPKPARAKRKPRAKGRKRKAKRR
jgi:hypothetical protein